VGEDIIIKSRTAIDRTHQEAESAGWRGTTKAQRAFAGSVARHPAKPQILALIDAIRYDRFSHSTINIQQKVLVAYKPTDED